ncbi:MAG: YfhO family protein, partial [Rhizobacter sp.]|nr:YfhO family protein [Chlorobiales bacterium]
GILFLLQRGSLSPIVAGALLGMLVVIDLNLSGAAFKDDGRSPADVYQLSPQAAASLKANVPSAFFRVKMREGRTMLLSRNHGLTSDIFLIEGFAALYSQRLMPPAPDEATSLDLMTVRYAIAIDSLQQSAYFDERNCRFPHARMVYRTLQVPPDSVAAVMRSGKIDFENEAVVETPLAISLSGFAKDSVAHKVRRTLYQPDAMQFDVETVEAGMLCLSEIWYPAWQATLDGRQTELHRTNYSLRGIEVPAGKHTVALRYESQAFAVGAWISGLALFTVGVALVWLNKKPPAQTKNLNGESPTE